MKKRKPSPPPPTEFNHHPFKALKGIKAATGQEKKPVSTPPKRVEPEEDAEELFLQAVSGARRIDPSAAAPEQRVQKALSEPIPVAPLDDQLFLQAMKKIGTSIKDMPQSDDEDVDYERRSASSRMKQLKRGTIRVSSELDLHGFLKDEAIRRLEQFIRDAYATGQQAVLVITGKGINSPEGPVLQGAVAAWLREKGPGKVAEFSAAPRDRGGSGAFVVFLKKK